MWVVEAMTGYLYTLLDNKMIIKAIQHKGQIVEVINSLKPINIK